MLENEDSTVSLNCPKCNRDYELPRRFLIHLEDLDFSPVPRLLPCLHSMCHSCLQDQFEKSQQRKQIECVLCHHQDIIKGVGYMPLDLSVLKQIVNSNSTELLAYCSKCYDLVPSMSWCDSCSSALCEFHHQDHKLSVHTSKHNFLTFQEYFHQNKHIQYKFPPVSCADVVMEDCQYYCQDCFHLLSSKAYIDHHKPHTIHTIDDIYPESNENLQSIRQNSKQLIENLQTYIHRIKDFLNQLDEKEESNVLLINKVFNQIIANLKQKEKLLIQQVTDKISEERNILLNQLTSFVESLEDCQQLQKLSDNYDQYCNPQTDVNRNERMYLISAIETIEDRCDELNKIVNEKIHQLNEEMVLSYEMMFNSNDLHLVNGTINGLGAIHTENINVEGRIRSFPNSSRGEGAMLEKHMMDLDSTEIGKRLRENSSFLRDNFGFIHFSVNVSEQKNEDYLEQRQSHQNLAENKSKEQLHRKSHTRLEGKAQDSTLVIEARWIPPKSYPNPLKKYTHLLEKQEGGDLDVIAVDIPDLNKPISTPGVSRSERPEADSAQKQSSEDKKNKETNNGIATNSYEVSAQESNEGHQNETFEGGNIYVEGILLGRIELSEKILKHKPNERHKIKTYFESKNCKPDSKNYENQLSFLSIRKEIVLD